MALKGHGSELPLADIVQASALARRRCRLKVRGIDLAGELFLDSGRVVHATYGELRGAPAFFTMVTDDYVLYHMETGVDAPEHTIDGSIEELLMEAMRLKDEARAGGASLDDPYDLGDLDDLAPLGSTESLSRPGNRPGNRDLTARSNGAPADDTGLPDRSGTLQAPPSHRNAASRPPGSSMVIAVVVALAIMGGGFGGWFVMAHRTIPNPLDPGTPSDGPATADATASPMEASDLNGPEDTPPELLTGTPPAAPRSNLGLRPTIVCRLLIDSSGFVRDRQIYRPRADLAEFEQVALEAVAEYRFSPARHSSKPIPAWINFPVTFR